MSKSAAQVFETPWKVWLERTPTSVDLNEGSFEEAPALLFLKGLKATRVDFREGAESVFPQWHERISDYQQRYLMDPDVLGLSEWTWDEFDPVRNEVLIHVEFEKAQVEKERRIEARQWHVPPMLGPMKVDAEAIRKFQAEVTNQSSRDVLIRFQSILKEFQNSSSSLDPKDWSALVTEIAAISLKLGFLERAIHLLHEHRPEPSIVSLQHLLSSYDPKPNEISLWNEIYSHYSTQWLLDQYEEMIPSSAGPSYLKLLHWRAQQRTEEFFDATLRASGSRLQSLHQWLSARWRGVHFDRISEKLSSTEDTNDFKLWTNALLRSDRTRALSLLKTFFPATRWFHLRYQGSPWKQKAIGEVLFDEASSESLQFLKEMMGLVHPSLKGFWHKLLLQGRES